MILPLLRIMIVGDLLKRQRIENLIYNIEKHSKVANLSVHHFTELYDKILASIDLVILEIKAIQFDGFKLVSHINAQSFNAKTLIYSSIDKRDFAMQYLKFGGSGYLQRKQQYYRTVAGNFADIER